MLCETEKIQKYYFYDRHRPCLVAEKSVRLWNWTFDRNSVRTGEQLHAGTGRWSRFAQWEAKTTTPDSAKTRAQRYSM